MSKEKKPKSFLGLMPKRSNRASTSIKINPDLWKEVKIEAIRRDIEVSELVEEALRKEIAGSKGT